MRNKIATSLITYLALIVGILNIYWFMIRDRFALIPGDLGDSRFILLLLEHNYQWLSGHAHGSFWSPSWIFYPQPNALAMSDVLTGASPIYALLRFLGLSKWDAYQFWHLCTGALNFGAAYLLARQLSISAVGSALSAYIFAFALPRAGFLNHPQLMAHWWTPLCIFLILKTISVRGQVREEFRNLSAVAAGLSWALQFWSAFYLGWFLGLGFLACGLVSFCSKPREILALVKLRRPQIILFLFSFCLLVGPLALKYLSMANSIGMHSKKAIFYSLPTFASWFLPADSSYFYQFLFNINVKSHPDFAEFTMFPGVVPLIGVASAILLLHKKNIKLAFKVTAASCIVLLMLTLRFSSVDSAWIYVMTFIPAAQAIRAMGRISLFFLLPMGICSGFLFDLLTFKGSRNWRLLTGGILTVLTVGEQWNVNAYGFPKALTEDRETRLRSTLSYECEAFYFNGRGEPAFMIQIDAMLASQSTGIPTINGYSGGEPPEFKRLALNQPANIDHGTLKAWLNFWHQDALNLCIQ